MEFSISSSIEVLENTPATVAALLHNLSPCWTNANEGKDTWTAKEVVAHLIVCEETNWLPRARTILSDAADGTFAAVDMNAHFELAAGRSLPALIDCFKSLRKSGIAELKRLNISESDLQKSAGHPKIGRVTLQQLIAAWTAHDLSHIVQIARIMAMQQKQHSGPFVSFLSLFTNWNATRHQP
jgi:hypothetical protein